MVGSCPLRGQRFDVIFVYEISLAMARTILRK
jgi:hypothetical protein